jgi:hypothetical protein
MDADPHKSTSTPSESVPSTLTLRDMWPVFIVLALYGVFLAALLLRWWPFDGMSWQNRSEFGDAFNVLSALFNGLAFAGLIITILIQSRELRLQRHQLSLQRIELQAQRAESKRLADAQEQQTLLNSISALVAAEAYSNRNSSDTSQNMREAHRFLTAHFQKEMARLRRADPDSGSR